MSAERIVDALLEADEINPKQFLDSHRSINVEAAFVHHGWAVRGPDEYGKVNSDGDVRWIVYTYEHEGHTHAYFGGQKLFEGEDRFGHDTRWWEDFEIDGELVLTTQTEMDFVAEIEDFLCDKTGPDEPEQIEPDYDDQDD